jgi:hypothetical protein
MVSPSSTRRFSGKAFADSRSPKFENVLSKLATELDKEERLADVIDGYSQD